MASANGKTTPTMERCGLPWKKSHLSMGNSNNLCHCKTTKIWPKNPQVFRFSDFFLGGFIVMKNLSHLSKRKKCFFGGKVFPQLNSTQLGR